MHLITETNADQSEPASDKRPVDPNPDADPTPDHIYIKVYPRRLRELARRYGLSRSELGELLLLALYINSDRECYPAKHDSVVKVGMRSGKWARALHKRLATKGVITLTQPGNLRKHRSPKFTLPDAFFFGSDKGQDSDPIRSGFRPLPGQDSDPMKGQDSDPKQESGFNINHQEEKLHNKHQLSSPGRVAVQSPNRDRRDDLNLEQLKTIGRLINAGVNEVEAGLIAKQYKTALINNVVGDCESSRRFIANPGGWIRRTLERIAGYTIVYPNSTEAIKTRVQQAIEHQDAQPNPYLKGLD